MIMPMLGRLGQLLKRSLLAPRQVYRTTAEVQTTRAELQSVRAEIVHLGQQILANVWEVQGQGRAAAERLHRQSRDGWAAVADELRRLRDHHAECFGLATADLRDRGSTAATWAGPDAPPAEPRFPDPGSFQERLAGLGADVRVRLSAAPREEAGYLEVTPFAAPGTDAIADPRRLPFLGGTLAELVCCHLLDRFPRLDARESLIPYWGSLLRPGGELRILALNWKAMAARLQRGELSLEAFQVVVAEAGGRTLYDPATLADLLSGAGLTEVRVVADDRRHGARSEMEVVART